MAGNKSWSLLKLLYFVIFGKMVTQGVKGPFRVSVGLPVGEDNFVVDAVVM